MVASGLISSGEYPLLSAPEPFDHGGQCAVMDAVDLAVVVLVAVALEDGEEPPRILRLARSCRDVAESA